jgi:hypothetical protein
MIGPLSHTQPDLVLPPTSKPLPGVYWHAMALDNLLHFGDAYKRDVYQLTTGITLPNTLLALAVFLVMAGIAYALAYAKAELHRDRRSQHQQRMRLLVERKGVLAHIVPDLAIATIFVGSHFIVAFAVGWFAFEHLNLAPVNWLGIFVTGVVLPPAVLAMSRSSR